MNPHEAIWPRRLPRALVLPQTSLWFNRDRGPCRVARRRRGGAGQPDEQGRRVRPHITDPQTKVVLTTADLAAIVADADGRLSEAQRLRHIVATCFSDAMPAVLKATATAPPPSAAGSES